MSTTQLLGLSRMFLIHGAMGAAEKARVQLTKDNDEDDYFVYRPEDLTYTCVTAEGRSVSLRVQENTAHFHISSSILRCFAKTLSKASASAGVHEPINASRSCISTLRI